MLPDVSGDVDESGSSVEPVDDAPAADDSTRDEGEVVETPVTQPVNEQAVVVQDQQSGATVLSEAPEATHSTSSNNSAVGVNVAAPEQPATTTNNEADVYSPEALGTDADTAEGGVFNLLLALGLLTLGAGGATALVVKTRRDRW